jgi:hypothetical protein
MLAAGPLPTLVGIQNRDVHRHLTRAVKMLLAAIAELGNMNQNPPRTATILDMIDDASIHTYDAWADITGNEFWTKEVNNG